MKKKDFSIDNALIVIGTIFSIGVSLYWMVILFGLFFLVGFHSEVDGESFWYSLEIIDGFYHCSETFLILFIIDHVCLLVLNLHLSHAKDEKSNPFNI